MGTHDDLARLDATAQAQLIRDRQITPLEPVEAAIERDEATLFRLAAQLEAARPWGDRRPALSAVR